MRRRGILMSAMNGRMSRREVRRDGKKRTENRVAKQDFKKHFRGYQKASRGQAELGNARTASGNPQGNRSRTILRVKNRAKDRKRERKG